MTRQLFIWTVFLGLTACSNGTVDNNTTADSSSDTTKPKYNPKVDSTYFFPADSNVIISDTSFSEYAIRTVISPIKGKYVIAYHEYVDNTPKMRTDKIFYRDYSLQIKIKNYAGFSVDKQISKNDFTSILQTETDNYSIRDVKFVGLDKNEFRFDIKISFHDSQDPTAMIKYFISKDNKFRFEDYPKSYYDSLNPDFDPVFIEEK